MPAYETDPDGTRWYTDLRDLGPQPYVYTNPGTVRDVGRPHPGAATMGGAFGSHIARHAFLHPTYPESGARLCCMELATRLSVNSDQYWNDPPTNGGPPSLPPVCGTPDQPGGYRVIGLPGGTVGAGCTVAGTTTGFGGGNQYVTGRRQLIGAALWVQPYLDQWGPDAGLGRPTWVPTSVEIIWEFDTPDLDSFDFGGDELPTGGGAGATLWGFNGGAVWGGSSYVGWDYDLPVAADVSYSGGTPDSWAPLSVAYGDPYADPATDPADFTLSADHSNVVSTNDYTTRTAQSVAVRMMLTARRYTIATIPVIRQYPRDDGRGMSSAPRLFPASPANRVFGGYT